jgi:hypothetical protein
MEPKNLDKMNDLQGYACLGVSVTVQLKGYDFFFRRERQDFVPDPGFTPFFWKWKGDDDGNDGPSQDNDGYDAPTRDASSASASMDVDNPQDGNSNSIGKSAAFFLLEARVRHWCLLLHQLILAQPRLEVRKLWRKSVPTRRICLPLLQELEIRCYMLLHRAGRISSLGAIQGHLGRC